MILYWIGTRVVPVGCVPAVMVLSGTSSGWWSPIQDTPHVLVVLTFVIVGQLK